MSLQLRFAARSDVGLIREGNEDSVYAGPRVLAVADGMGGHAAGEVASAVAIAGVASLDEDDPGSDLLDALRETALAANERLRDMVSGDSGLDGMGTTLTALLFAGTRLGLLHIGDSRCYLLRDGELSQITTDHTLVQTLVDEGRISEEEASTHPQRSLITRALDGRGSIDPDLSVREARVGDRYLLCTDGLTGPVGRKKTLQEALQIADPQQAVDRLVELALRGGAPDNVTVIVADVVDAQGGTAAPVVAGAAADAPQAAPPVGDTPAARARLAEGRATPPPRPAASAPVVDPPVRPRRTGRLVLLSLVVLGLLAAGAFAGWSYVRSQYYVGVDGDAVAVFRGVDAEVAGVSLASVEERTDLQMDALDDVARRTVERGYVADDKQDAEAFVARLEEQATARCQQQAAAATPSPTPTPAAPPAAGTAPAPTPAPTPAAPEPETCGGTAS